MKYTLLYIIGITLLSGMSSCTSQDDYSTEQMTSDHEQFFFAKKDQLVKSIVDNISVTYFPDFRIEINPLEDPERDCLPFFQKAIDDCSNAGGGVVNINKGKYLLRGTLRLKSNVCLDVNDGALVSFSGDPKDFLPVVFSRWEGTEMYGRAPMIYAYKSNNIAIVGRGTIDARGGEHFAKWADIDNDLEGQDAIRLHKMNTDDEPVAKRIFGEGTHLRPSMIQMLSCSRILIDGVHLRESPFWTIHPIYCDNVIVRNVDIVSFYRNNDGCVPESSSNVLIENCTFKVGDDAVAIKSGRNLEGRRISRPAENIIVRNCLFWSDANGLTIGSEVSGGVQNVFMDSIRIEKVGNALFFKSNADRGGYIRNVYVNNITIKKTRGAVINFNMDFSDYAGGDLLTRFENFYMHDIRAVESDEYGIFINGKELLPIKNVKISKLKLDRAKRKYHVFNCTGVNFYNCVVNNDTLPLVPIPNDERRLLDVQ